MQKMYPIIVFRAEFWRGNIPAPRLIHFHVGLPGGGGGIVMPKSKSRNVQNWLDDFLQDVDIFWESHKCEWVL